MYRITLMKKQAKIVEEGVHGHLRKKSAPPPRTYLTVPWTEPGLCQIS